MPPTPSRQTLESLVAAAVQAPSSHNTQPWLFELTDGGIGLVADRTRALPVNDPYDRELTISCGAALFNLTAAARYHGLDPAVGLLPDPAEPDLLARVELAPATAAPPERLFDAIPTRRTTRGRFDDGPLPEALPGRLVDAAATHGLTVHVVAADQRSALADLVAEGDRSQLADPRWRRELASWLHPRRRGDGLVVPEVVGLAARAVLSTFDLGRSVAGKDHDLVESAPMAAVVASDADDPRAWVTTGRALQHLLLIGAREGVHAGYVNQPCQVDGLRSRLQQLLPGRRFPQLVLRLGPLAEPPRATPRRPIEDVIVDPAS